MENKILEILNPIKENLLGVIINESIKNYKQPTSEQLYEATRKEWKIGESKIEHIKYVFGITDDKIKIIIKVNKYKKTQDQKRYIFEGDTSFTDLNLNSLIGQQASPIFGTSNGQPILYYKADASKIEIKLNQILYGPPGTGKTYNSVIKALEIIDSSKIIEGDYKKTLNNFNQLKEDGQIEFVTFHQSYGYEEFVEGIKPIPAGKEGNENNSEMIYDVVDGVFKRICTLSQEKSFTIDESLSTENSSIWKISLGGTGVHQVKTKCFANGEIRIGWNDAKAIDDVEFNKLGTSNQSSIRSFIADMKIGDFVVSIASVKEIDGIGIILSDALQDDDKDYNKVRKVKWLLLNKKINLMSITRGVTFTQKTVYKLERVKLKDLLQLLPQDINYLKLKYDNAKTDFVLIIDEINRGNISKIFGELITLIEKSKRAGNDEAISVRLPYSGEMFSVPKNLYIIGTMNTADRSIALMDTALRRRFEFVEMQPKPQLLSENVDGVNLKELLETINQRIEYLYDRDHTIGHAYFMGITDFAGLCNVFANKIIPLLQEYFYDDWEKIRLVLADNQVNELEYQFIQIKKPPENLFGTSTNDFIETDKIIYTINTSLKTQEINVQAFIKIYKIKNILDEQHADSIASTETSQDQGS